MKQEERLTLHRLTSAYDYEKSHLSSDKQEAIYDRLSELEDKIEYGTLVELRCKSGDFVWSIKKVPIWEKCSSCGLYSKTGAVDYQVEKVKCISVTIKDDDKNYHLEPDHSDCLVGYTVYEVFSTKAEAEAKVKELRGEK